MSKLEENNYFAMFRILIQRHGSEAVLVFTHKLVERKRFSKEVMDIFLVAKVMTKEE